MADLSKYLASGGVKKVVAVVTNASAATITPSSNQYAALIALCQDGYGQSTSMTLSVGGSDPRENQSARPWSEASGEFDTGGVAVFVGRKGESITYSDQGNFRWSFMGLLMEDN